MTVDRSRDAGWVARVAAAGVPVELFAAIDDRDDFLELQRASLGAVSEARLSDDDAYSLVTFLWWRGWPPILWPADASAVARRCAAELSGQMPCELHPVTNRPTPESIQAARDAIVADLRLMPGDLLAAVADHWHELSGIAMPDDDSPRTLLAFAEHVLLEPLIGACFLIWLAADLPVPEALTIPAAWSTHPWGTWTLWSEWPAIATDELARLGYSRDGVPPRVDDELDELLAVARAALLREHGDTTLVAASIVRTSCWPGDRTLITSLVERAVCLALDRWPAFESDPDPDLDAVADQLQRELMPPDETLLDWIRDPSCGTLAADVDTAPRTGAEMLDIAAGWVAMELCLEAILVARASAQPSVS